MDKEHRMLEARVLQRQGKTQAEIAAALGVCERTVRNHLKGTPARKRNPVRGSRVDPYKQLIDSILEENPSYNGQLIFERITKLGYTGKISVMKDYVARVRRRLEAKAVIRFETEPGWQAQVDWKEFGKQMLDGTVRKLYAFVMVLGYSRKPFVWFTTSMDQGTLLACHILAFKYFGGVASEILYDNMRTAFRFSADGVWQPTRRLLALAAYYGFTPLRCRIRRPETKGKVERTVGYLDNNFWPRMEGVDLSLAQLNQDALAWIEAISIKPLRDFGMSRAERFDAERPHLKPVREADFDVRDAIPLKVNREARITWLTNRYSVPAAYIGDMLVLMVHPLHSQAEIILPNGQSRRFPLAQAGMKQCVDYPGDRELLMKRWGEDRVLVARQRTPKRCMKKRSEVEVQRGSALTYEAICRAMAASAGARA
jgi:transposase